MNIAVAIVGVVEVAKRMRAATFLRLVLVVVYIIGGTEEDVAALQVR